MPRGYDRPLYIQPFDHRGSFQTKLFGWKPPLSASVARSLTDRVRSEHRSSREG
jgi:hypothetical protein